MNFKVFLIAALLVLGAFAADEATKEATDAEKVDVEVTKQEAPKPWTIFEPSVDARVVGVFPESADRVFPLGKKIDVVLGFTNKGQTSFNITHITASLMYPQDWRVHLQNYTRQYYFTEVKPNEEVSVQYSFFPDPLLEPRDFGLTARVFYTNDLGTVNYTSTFVNTTLVLVEADESFDAQTLFTYVGLFGVVGMIAFVIFNSLSGMSKKKGRRATRVETGTQKEGYEAEWLEGTAAISHVKATKSPTKTRKAVKKTN